MSEKFVLCLLLAVAIVATTAETDGHRKRHGSHRYWPKLVTQRPYRKSWRGRTPDGRNHRYGKVVSTCWRSKIGLEKDIAPKSAELNQKTASWESLEKWGERQFSNIKVGRQVLGHKKSLPDSFFGNFGRNNDQLLSLEKFTNSFGFL
jgi:hypothetical protein